MFKKKEREYKNDKFDKYEGIQKHNIIYSQIGGIREGILFLKIMAFTQCILAIACT